MRSPENQISSPLEDQAKPFRFFQPLERVVLCPPRSTTETEPSSSPRFGWSRKAIRSPFGDNRGYVIQPAASYSTLPIGYSSRKRPSKARTTARFFASGD